MKSLLSVSSEFKRVLAIQFLTYFGEGFYMLAVLIHLERVSSSPALISAMITLMMLPALFVGPLLGSFLDHFSFRNVVITGLLSRGLCILGIAAWTTVYSQSVLGLGALILINEIFWYTITPAVDALVKLNLNEGEYHRGESLNVFSFQLATVSSMLLAGWSTSQWGVKFSLVVGAASYFAPALFVTFLRSGSAKKAPKAAEAAPTGVLSLLKTSPVLLPLLLLGAWNFPFAQVVTVLLNGLNFKMLGGNETTLGQLGALYALGALVGSILGLRLKATKGLGRLYLAYAMLAVLLVLIALVSHYTTAVVVYALIGLIATVQRILLRAILYPVIPSQVVGRFFAVMSTVSVVIAIGAVLAYGWLGDYHVRTSYALLALAPLAALILVLRLARLQKVS